MSEQLRHPEQGPRPEQNELQEAAAERLKKLETRAETSENKAEQVDAAREKLRQLERTPSAHEAAPKAEPTPTYQGVLTKAANYRHTMASLQHRMKPAARRFSKFIHRPTVENVSEALGKTVLRPSVSLGAVSVAVVTVGFVYLSSRHYGFVMQGSVLWISLLAGGILGLIVEGVYRLIKRPSTR